MPHFHANIERGGAAGLSLLDYCSLGIREGLQVLPCLVRGLAGLGVFESTFPLVIDGSLSALRKLQTGKNGRHLLSPHTHSLGPSCCFLEWQPQLLNTDYPRRHKADRGTYHGEDTSPSHCRTRRLSPASC